MALRQLDIADGFASESVPGDIPLPEGAATDASLELIFEAIKLLAKKTETQPVSIASSVAVTIADPVSVLMTSKVQTGLHAEDLTVSTTPETFVAPAGAFACFIQAEETNATNLRVKMGGTASPTSGIQFQGGRSEMYEGGSNVSYCSESGTGKISIQWFVRT